MSIQTDLEHGWRYVLARRAKLLVYLLAAAGFLVTNGLVHGQVAEWVNLAIAFAGALGVHQVPNAPHRPSPHAKD